MWGPGDVFIARGNDFVAPVYREGESGPCLAHLKLNKNIYIIYLKISFWVQVFYILSDVRHYYKGT